MKQYLLTLGTLVFTLLIVFAPFSGVLAQSQFPGDEGTSGIVPCGDDPTNPCNACDLVSLAQETINFAVYFTIFVATLLFVYAGFKYITAGGDSGKIKEATKVFWSVLVGMVIVLTAWLVVDILMKTFLNQGNYGPWQEILCTPSLSGVSGTGGSFASSPSPSGGLGVGSAPPPPPAQIESNEYTHEQAHSLLSSEGIVVTSSGGCSSQFNSSCTSLQGVKQDTISGIIALRNACSTSGGQACILTVTGGTEMGVHAEGQYSHENGYKLDLSKQNSRFLDGYLTAQGDTFTIPDPQTGTDYEYTIIDEGTHYDVRIIRRVTF
jgi:hypothetical protein